MEKRWESCRCQYIMYVPSRFRIGSYQNFSFCNAFSDWQLAKRSRTVCVTSTKISIRLTRLESINRHRVRPTAPLVYRDAGSWAMNRRDAESWAMNRRKEGKKGCP